MPRPAIEHQPLPLVTPAVEIGSQRDWLRDIADRLEMTEHAQFRAAGAFDDRVWQNRQRDAGRHDHIPTQDDRAGPGRIAGQRAADVQRRNSDGSRGLVIQQVIVGCIAGDAHANLDRSGALHDASDGYSRSRAWVEYAQGAGQRSAVDLAAALARRDRLHLQPITWQGAAQGRVWRRVWTGVVDGESKGCCRKDLGWIRCRRSLDTQLGRRRRRWRRHQADHQRGSPGCVAAGVAGPRLYGEGSLGQGRRCETILERERAICDHLLTIHVELDVAHLHIVAHLRSNPDGRASRRLRRIQRETGCQAQRRRRTQVVVGEIVHNLQARLVVSHVSQAIVDGGRTGITRRDVGSEQGVGLRRIAHVIDGNVARRAGAVWPHRSHTQAGTVGHQVLPAKRTGVSRCNQREVGWVGDVEGIETLAMHRVERVDARKQTAVGAGNVGRHGETGWIQLAAVEQDRVDARAGQLEQVIAADTQVAHGGRLRRDLGDNLPIAGIHGHDSAIGQTGVDQVSARRDRGDIAAQRDLTADEGQRGIVHIQDGQPGCAVCHSHKTDAAGDA